ncbi:energy transducer TonB family protein [Bradyrhizobium cajani]|uniref:TonB family protein n=1 Tax=Bradyrhizobium cajani TaxID=1928661 RepID=A0A844T8L6_9BRAD|nr:energy transducer TonB [Bradyrhizobium cajani]MCP3369123.1 energy transducer TonB [Bradyrhizobium cajani]MVT72769.1 TonB family protein [Bradyrhizobium cajani]
MPMKFPLLAALLGLLTAFPSHAQTDAPNDNVKAWKMRLRAHIASRTQFPPAAMGQTGEAKVTFVMDRSGKLISRTLVESTGSPPLDAAALAIVERAQPFPEAPAELTEPSFSFTVPIVFSGRQFQIPPSGLVTVAPVPASTVPDAMATWRKAVTEHVWRNRGFPPGAIGQRGDAGVTFVVDRSGKLISRALVESTGSRLLDTAALAMVERAAPFPKPPPEANDDLQRVTVLMTLDGTMPKGQSNASSWVEDEAKLKTKLNSVCRGC